MFSVKVLAGAALALGIAAAAANAQVVVSSKIDTEGGVLGNIILPVLKANDVPTTDQIQLGGTPVVREAIAAGEIDIYPEYTGNAAFFFEEGRRSVWNDAAKGYEQAKKLDYDANKIVWLTPSPANNTWAIAVRKDVAEANKLRPSPTSAPMSPAAARSMLAASAEFVNSAAALPAFQTTYGFTLKPDQLITLSGGDTAATIAAAAQPDQRRQCRHGLRHRRRHRALGPRRARRRQGRAAGLPAGADHPRGGAEGASARSRRC